MSRKLIAVAAALLLALPAAASAASKTYGGTSDGGTSGAGEGQIAMDVTVDKAGKPRRITELRGNNIPAQCEQSGQVMIYLTYPTSIVVDKHGRFFAEFVQPTHGNKSWIRGRFLPKKVVNGNFVFDQHFLADGTYPEENCSTGQQAYRATRGGPDVVPPTPGQPRLPR
jgi:hypothetical protein